MRAGFEPTDLNVEDLDQVPQRLETDLVGLTQPDLVQVPKPGGTPHLP